MAIYPSRFTSDPTLKPKTKKGKKKEVNIMACKTKKKASTCKTGKKGGK